MKTLRASNFLLLGIGFALVLLDLPPNVHAGGSPPRETRTPGDTNCDGQLDLSDAIFTLNYLFRGTTFPPCPLADPPELLARITELETQLAAAQGEISRLAAESSTKSESLATCQATLQAAATRIHELEIPGCTDPSADNYRVKANVDDGSCEYSGCTNPLAFNFDPRANVDDGSCRFASDAPGRLHLYTIAALPPLSPHDLSSQARGINNAGQVVGHSLYEVLWEPDGSVVSLANPDGGTSSVYLYLRALNDLGVMVGSVNDSFAGTSFPIRWRLNSTIEELPGGLGQATDINNEGVAIGYTYSDTEPSHGVLWETDGRFTFLEELPGSTRPTYLAINNLRQVVGSAYLEGGPVPLIWDENGAVRRLPGEALFAYGWAEDNNDKGLVVGNLGFAVQWDSSRNDELLELIPDPASGASTSAFSVNDIGQILISSEVYKGGDWIRQIYVYGDGSFALLADLLVGGSQGWSYLNAVDINDSGVIVGFGALDSITRAFIMRPTERFYLPR